jgi:predicted AlkP superfamily phosphohydrolase/phosphomutase
VSARHEVESYVAFDGTGRVSVALNGRGPRVLTVAEAEALRDELSAALERLENWDQAGEVYADEYGYVDRL